MLIIKTIIIDLTIIFLIFTIFLVLGYIIRESLKEEQPGAAPIVPEEKKKFYLQLINTSTHEILSFKNKKEFLSTIQGLDTIKYFLKGTEEENTNQLIKWYYPEYKKL